jgi:hypothetical protein
MIGGAMFSIREAYNTLQDEGNNDITTHIWIHESLEGSRSSVGYST